MRLHFAELVLCAVFLALPLSAIPASAQNLAEGSGYMEAVSGLQRDGVIDSSPSMDVRLNDPLSRAEALKIILKSQSKYASELTNIMRNIPELALFPDVEQRAWYAPYVELGFRSKLVTGYPDGFFRPQRGVKVEEAATMLVRSYGFPAQEAPYLSTDDLRNAEGQWFTNALSLLNLRGAILPGSSLRLGQELTRGQFFSMVYRFRKGRSGASTVGQQGGGDGPPIRFASQKNFAITIPSLGITDLTVTHPDDPFSSKGVLEPLRNGVGHLFSYPGEGSKMMIYGHSSGYPWDISLYTKIFRTINKMKIGSRVYVTYAGKLYVYQVTGKKAVQADDRTPFEPDENGEELILYTCWPPDSISQRFIVIAMPVETIALRKL